ncbi:MAG: UDP-N-acetylenolpyruvoylglucosamine reductase, UDP-N-acetylmuramate dehydrogenase [Parcubacteria group bacterium]|nr:UDP-N-acetylenolpyruvoylglucosamine reductase, UDP-N-acetylmuramate dehydrogenase [Parcubacteria group bacterium]
MKIEENVVLAEHTTFKIGGPAKLFITCESVEDVEEAVALARERDLAVYPLGEGSNVLASDEAIEKAVLRISIPGITYQETEGKDGVQTLVTVGAGVTWDALVDDVTNQGLWGLENLAGIPGTIGGAAVQNIGAYGAVFEDSVISIEAYDLATDTVRTFSRAECDFNYRMSIFKKSTGSLIVTHATLALSEEPMPRLGYRDIEEYFASTPAPTLLEIRDAVRSIRAKKFPNLSLYGTAGSFFLNPVLPTEEAERIAAKYPGMPLFPMPEGGIKVPIAWFLDYRHDVLDMREVRAGKALVWPIQPLVLASEPGATAADVNALATLVIERMKEATGISISREVQWLS